MTPGALTRNLAVGAALAGFTAAACKQVDQQDAIEVQREARHRIEEAKLEANEKISKATRDAEQAGNEAARARSDVRADLQKDVDAVDRTIAALSKRGETASGAATKDVESARTEVDARRAAVQTDLGKLETEMGAAWDTAKARATDGIHSLEAAVEKWERAASEKAARR